MTLDQGPTSLYYQLKTILKSKILSNELKDNNRLSSEAELCTGYQVSRVTARQALSGKMKDRLIDRGYYSRDDSLMFVTIAYFRSDLYKYRTEFKRDLILRSPFLGGMVH